MFIYIVQYDSSG